jgi:hypothetical protein
MLGGDLHHHVVMTVLGLAGFAQIIIIAHRTLEARSMEVAHAASIADDTAVACAWAVGSSKTATATRPMIVIYHDQDAGRHLIGAVDLDHGVRGWGTGFTRGTQIVVVTNSALEARPG